MREYIALEHMSPVNPSLDIPLVYYIPHHSVIKESSLTTKCRVVFDASTKSSSNLSLNDVLKVGPNIQEDIFSIMLRFRYYAIVFTADVEKMYRQVLMADEDRDLQRIVWRENPHEPLIHYKLNTITYGTSSASFLATRCLKQLALENEREFPQACQVVLRDFYVDDLISGSDDLKSAQTLVRQITSILHKGGFPLRKWMSNNSSLLDTQTQGDNINLSQFVIRDNQNSKTLGTLWSSSEDTLQYFSEHYNFDKIITKRVILSVVSQTFDPLGLLGPIIIKSKIFMQKLWMLKLDWDEEVPYDLRSQFLKFCNNLKAINNIKIPRYIFIENYTSVEIHCFCDASQAAYGSAIYMQAQDSQGNLSVSLACAKSRVAPLKCQSLPRLELCGAVLNVQLAQRVIAASNFNAKNVFYWTDSTIVLAWISTEPSRLNTFVSNRIAQIQSLSSVNQWRHVASENNPADLISRGVDPSYLNNIRLWWDGPEFLKLDALSWPSSFNFQLSEIPEIKTNCSIACVTLQSSGFNEIINRYSSFLKLIHVVAYVLRFKNNCLFSTIQVKGDLTLTEIDRSTNHIIKLIQNQEFSSELQALRRSKHISRKSKLSSLNPFLDDDGIVRVGGRLSKSTLSFEAKFPIVLPAKHHFSKLLIRHQHETNLHAGPQTTLSIIRSKYWPLNGRRAVRDVIKGCYACFRAKPAPSRPHIMGDLPNLRVNESRAFSVCSVDYCGPFLIKDGKLRNRKYIKSYVCIFICFSSKAIHIELVTELSTGSFLNALRRFVSRRGICYQIYSDNATNFTGANKHLQGLVSLPEHPNVRDYFIKNKIKWTFSPARSPHFNGLAESAVKLVKYHLKRVAQNTPFNFEEFYTLLTQIEAIANSRPLTLMSQDPNDLQALTPGHFIIGEPLTSIPDSTQPEIKGSLLTRYQHIRVITGHFWKRWSLDYLHNLQQRSKWKTRSHDVLKVGSLAVIREDNTPPQDWKLGRIIKVHPGQDGVVRVVTLKTNNGIIKRASVKISVLPDQ